MGNSFKKSEKDEAGPTPQQIWQNKIDAAFAGRTRVDLGSTGHDNMKDDGACYVATKLSDTKYEVVSLDLYRHDIGIRGANALCEALGGNQILTKINLNHNNFGDDGALALANALKYNSVIEEIHLDENNIGDAGIIALAKVLACHKSLKKVYLTENKFGPDGRKALDDAKEANGMLCESFYY